MRELSGAGPSRVGRRRGRGTGNPGKPGKRLRLEDLQSQFGVGLKEAANRLGICPTTLKARAGTRGPGPGRLFRRGCATAKRWCLRASREALADADVGHC